MQMVATQVTKDVLRLPGHEVPGSSKTIESIIGDDPIGFTNSPLNTEISESDVDEDPKQIQPVQYRIANKPELPIKQGDLTKKNISLHLPGQFQIKQMEFHFL